MDVGCSSCEDDGNLTFNSGMHNKQKRKKGDKQGEILLYCMSILVFASALLDTNKTQPPLTH